MKPKSILLVDDNLTFMQSAIRFLTVDMQFAVVGWAFTAEEAMKKIELLKPDIILIDTALPDISGIELTKQIRYSLDNSLIILTSVYDNNYYRSEAELCGAHGYVAKINFGNEFIPTINKLFLEVNNLS